MQDLPMFVFLMCDKNREGDRSIYASPTKKKKIPQPETVSSWKRGRDYTVTKTATAAKMKSTFVLGILLGCVFVVQCHPQFGNELPLDYPVNNDVVNDINNGCDPGVCGAIPGLVYNPQLDQCAWPDEVGCRLEDLGYSSYCDINAYDLKAADFQVDLPPGRSQDQYFVVCVPATTETDRLARSLFPTGPVVPRLIGCPGMQVFDREAKMCV